jgi:hypothetical protein
VIPVKSRRRRKGIIKNKEKGKINYFDWNDCGVWFSHGAAMGLV